MPFTYCLFGYMVAMVFGIKSNQLVYLCSINQIVLTVNIFLSRALSRLADDKNIKADAARFRSNNDHSSENAKLLFLLS